MPSIDESIRKIDNVICRHLDEIENNSRGAISQDILEQLTKFVNHIMLKFYANGREISITAENIAKATGVSTPRLFGVQWVSSPVHFVQ